MMRQYGFQIAIAVIVPMVGALAFYIHSRVRVNEQRETNQIKTESAPLEVLRRELDLRTAEVNKTRDQFFSFIQSQMARNDAQTKAMLEMVAENRAQTEALKNVTASLTVHMESSSARASKIYDKISDINERVTGMEKSIDTISRIKA